MTQLNRLLQEVNHTQDQQIFGLDSQIPAIREQLLQRRAREVILRRVALGATLFVAAAAIVLVVSSVSSPTVSYEAKSETLPTAFSEELQPASLAVDPAPEDTSVSPPQTKPLPSNESHTVPEPVSERVVREREAQDEWKALARAGDYSAALEGAKQQGIARLLKVLDTDDLLLLAEASRFSGDTATSVTALQAIRTRFPAHPQAAVATFSLGRLEADKLGNSVAAAKYFQSYLEEEPAGPLASAALGRLIESLLQTGQTVGAVKAAKTYLQRFPQGPHAELARRVLSGEATR